MENHCIFRRDNLIPRLEPFIFRIYLLIVFFWIRICSISKEDTQDFLGSSPCSVWSKGSDQSESPIHLWHDWFFSVGRAGTAAWRISSISSLWRLVAIFLGNMRRRSGTTCWRISCPLSLFSITWQLWEWWLVLMNGGLSTIRIGWFLLLLFVLLYLTMLTFFN